MNTATRNELQDFVALCHDSMLARLLNENSGAILVVLDDARKQELCNAYEVKPKSVVVVTHGIYKLNNPSVVLYDHSLFMEETADLQERIDELERELDEAYTDTSDRLEDEIDRLEMVNERLLDEIYDLKRALAKERYI